MKLLELCMRLKQDELTSIVTGHHPSLSFGHHSVRGHSCQILTDAHSMNDEHHGHRKAQSSQSPRGELRLGLISGLPAS